jgi:ubiquinone/menaquinone biosynthesis C-methylase UbiE
MNKFNTNCINFRNILQNAYKLWKIMDDEGIVEAWWDNRYKNEQYIWDKVPSKCTETSLDILKSQGIKKILDLPCGYGRDSIFLSKNGFEVTGIDRSKEAIKLAQSWAQEEGLNIEFLQGDATELEFLDETFDAIVSNRFLHLVYDNKSQEKVSKEMHRVIKDNGLLILATRSIKDPDCNKKNEIDEELHELHDRPGHKIRFNTIEELQTLFGHFEEITVETVEELESLERQISCNLLKIVAKK